MNTLEVAAYGVEDVGQGVRAKGKGSRNRMKATDIVLTSTNVSKGDRDFRKGKTQWACLQEIGLGLPYQ